MHAHSRDEFEQSESDYAARQGQYAASGAGFSFGGFFWGLTLGVSLAMLFAPQSGEETRGLIADQACQRWDQIASAGSGLKRRAQDKFEGARNRVNRALEAGREAYHDAQARPM